MSFKADHGSTIEQGQPVASTTGRWEWRTFAAMPYSPTVAIRPLDTPASRAPRESAPSKPREAYFVSARTLHNVKIRANRLQVKRLVTVNRTGLQQWRPILDTPFPVGGVRLRAFCTALGIAGTSVPTRRYDQCDLVEYALLCDPALRVVNLTKHRTPIPLQGCSGEHVTLEVAGRQWYSLAFEHDDPVRIRSVIHRMGLTHLCNTSYPAFLAQVAGTRSNRPRIVADMISIPNNTEAP